MRAICSASVSYLFIYLFLIFSDFNDSCHTNYLKIIDRADLRQNVQVGRTMVVEVISLKLVFRSLKGRCHGNQFVMVLSTKLIGVVGRRR